MGNPSQVLHNPYRVEEMAWLSSIDALGLCIQRMTYGKTIPHGYACAALAVAANRFADSPYRCIDLAVFFRLVDTFLRSCRRPGPGHRSGNLAGLRALHPRHTTGLDCWRGVDPGGCLACRLWRMACHQAPGTDRAAIAGGRTNTQRGMRGKTRARRPGHGVRHQPGGGHRSGPVPADNRGRVHGDGAAPGWARADDKSLLL